MPGAKALLGSLIGRLIFTEAEIGAVEELSEHFRSIRLQGADLAGADFWPGDKLRVFLPEAGLRTYTPMRWDGVRGTTHILAYLHGQGPGAQWARSVRPKDSFQFLGPRRSIELPSSHGPVFFGDETAFGLACALDTVAAGAVFEVNDAAESAGVLRSVGLGGAAVVQRTPGEGHLEEAHRLLMAALHARPQSQLVMAGKAQSIQRLRKSLRGAGVNRPGKNKAYWAVGKRGLD